jgi:hypothetical protein
MERHYVGLRGTLDGRLASMSKARALQRTVTTATRRMETRLYDMALPTMVPRPRDTEIDTLLTELLLVSRYEILDEPCLVQLRLPVNLPLSTLNEPLPPFHLLPLPATTMNAYPLSAKPHSDDLGTRKPGFLVESSTGHYSSWSSLPSCSLSVSCAGDLFLPSPWPSSLGFSSSCSLLVLSKSTSAPHLVLRYNILLRDHLVVWTARAILPLSKIRHLLGIL